MNEEKVIHITEDASIVNILGNHPSEIYADRDEADYTPKPVKAVYITDPEISNDPKKIWPPEGETIICLWGIIDDCLIILNVLTRNATGDYEDSIKLSYDIKTNGLSTASTYPGQCNGVVLKETSIINGGSDYLLLMNLFTTPDNTAIGTSDIHIFSITLPTDITFTITGNTTDLNFNVDIWSNGDPIMLKITDTTNRGYTHYLLAIGEYVKRNYDYPGYGEMWYLRKYTQDTIVVDSAYKSLKYGYIPNTTTNKTDENNLYVRLNLEKVYGIGPSSNNGWVNINNIDDYDNDTSYTILGSTDGTNFQIMDYDVASVGYNRFITFSGDSIIMSTECIIEASLADRSIISVNPK